MPAPASTTRSSATTATSTIVLTHHEDPRTFCGTAEVDVEDSIVDYERVSEINRWNSTLMLANVPFYLKGTAKVWFENLTALFGPTGDWKLGHFQGKANRPVWANHGSEGDERVIDPRSDVH